MKDRMKASLSALCDGECDELEVRRILNQVGTDPELRQQWQRYHLVGSVMRGEPTSSVDLLKGINQALDGEPMDEVPASFQQVHHAAAAAETPKREFSQWFVSGAVAATVTLAVLAGFRMTAATDQGFTPAVAVKTSVQSAPVTTIVDASASAAAQNDLREAQEMLQQYVFENQSPANVFSDSVLNQSAAYARVANFGKETEVETQE